MPADIELKFDEATARRFQRDLASVRNGWPRAAKRAINRTLTSLRGRAARRIAKEHGGIKTKAIRNHTYIQKASQRVLAGFIRFSSRRIPIHEMKRVRQTSTGVSYQGPGGTRKIPHAFLISTIRGVWKRAKKGGKLVPRLPITLLRGPSAKEIWDEHGGMAREVREDGQQKLRKELKSAHDYLLQRYTG